MKLASLHIDVRPGEGRNVLAAFLTLGGFMAGHALLETARDALFLASLPARQLPWVYLAIALMALLLTQVQRRVAAQYSPRSEMSLWLALCSVVTLVFWFLVGWAGDWIFYVLYVWSGLLATLVVVRFWMTLGALFSFTQAKRLFAVIGSGSVLGAIGGSALAVGLAEVVAARSLVIAAALVFLVSAAAPAIFQASPAGSRRQSTSRPFWELGRLSRLVWNRNYLRRVAILICVSTVTFTLVDYLFKSTAGRLVPSAQLEEFFSSVYLTLNILSLGVQLFVVSWLLRRFGVQWAQAIPPLLLAAGSAGFLIGGGLAAALLLKGVDGATRHSLNRTVTELLFVSLSEKTREQVKAFIDVLGQRGGQALASILILAGLAFSSSDFVFCAAALVFAGLWLFLAITLKRHYLDVFRETLSTEITQTRIDFPTLDLASMEMLISTLNDPDDQKVLAALDLLGEQGKESVIPALILYHPSSAVVLRSLELMARADRDDFVPVVERVLNHSDPEVRAASLRALSSQRKEEARLRKALRDDPSPVVRATALVGLVSGGWLAPEEGNLEKQFLRKTSVDEAIGLARAIRSQPSAVFEDVLLKLAVSPEQSVRREALLAMREMPSRRFIPTLLSTLALRALREEAGAVFLAIGPEALTALAAGLADGRLSHAVRRHIPSAVARFQSPEAGHLLLDRLQLETDGMVRFKILRALGKMRTQVPTLPLDRNVLEKVTRETLEGALRLAEWGRSLQLGARQQPARATSVHLVLVTLLMHKERHAVERVFRLLNLMERNEEFRRIHRGLLSAKPEARSSSRELLEHMVAAEIRLPLLTVVDDLETRSPEKIPDDAREPADYESVLQMMLSRGSETLSCLAAYHVGELGLRNLRPTLEDTLDEHRGVHSRVVQHALELLSRAPDEKASHGG